MLPETTAVAAATAPIATSTYAQSRFVQLPIAPICVASSRMWRVSTWQSSSYPLVVRGK